jgi:hypothetical protein
VKALLGMVALIAVVAYAWNSVSGETQAAAPVETNRCLNVPRVLRDAIASSLKPGVRLGSMQAVKSDETWSRPGRTEAVYWVAADLHGPKKKYIMGTWSVLRSLGPDFGLIWVADDRVAKVSDLGIDVPLKVLRSLPDDGWNEAQDCLMWAE